MGCYSITAATLEARDSGPLWRRVGRTATLSQTQREDDGCSSVPSTSGARNVGGPSAEGTGMSILAPAVDLSGVWTRSAHPFDRLAMQSLGWLLLPSRGVCGGSWMDGTVRVCCRLSGFVCPSAQRCRSPSRLGTLKEMRGPMALYTASKKPTRCCCRRPIWKATTVDDGPLLLQSCPVPPAGGIWHDELNRAA